MEFSKPFTPQRTGSEAHPTNFFCNVWGHSVESPVNGEYFETASLPGLTGRFGGLIPQPVWNVRWSTAFRLRGTG